MNPQEDRYFSAEMTDQQQQQQTREKERGKWGVRIAAQPCVGVYIYMCMHLLCVNEKLLLSYILSLTFFKNSIMY